MDDDFKGRDDSRGRDEVYSEKIRAGKRTYFFDVRATRSNDYYITITESKRRFNGHGYDKHKIFLYKEDFNKFMAALDQTIDHVKTNLMPDYDYNEFDRRPESFYEGSSNESTPAASSAPAEAASDDAKEKVDELSTTWED